VTAPLEAVPDGKDVQKERRRERDEETTNQVEEVPEHAGLALESERGNQSQADHDVQATGEPDDHKVRQDRFPLLSTVGQRSQSLGEEDREQNETTSSRQEVRRRLADPMDRTRENTNC
jgi:hypothetical protein